MCFLLTALRLHLHEQPLLARDLGGHILVVDKVVQCRETEADPAEVLHQGLGVGGAVDGDDEAGAVESRQLAELEEGHEAGTVS